MAENLHILLVDGDAERADRLRAVLRATAPSLFELTHVRAPEEAWRHRESAIHVAVLSLDEDEYPLETAEGLAEQLPDVPMIAVGGKPPQDPSWCIDRGIQEHLPRSCVECGGGSRLITAVRWAAERNRLLKQVEFVQQRSVHMALHDELTGLPNRQLCSDRLRQLLIGAERHGRGFAVMFVDLDRFKQINDTLGHEVGDRLLVEVGRRLRGCLRASDTSARWGGDEFILLLDGVPDSRGALLVVDELRKSLSQPFRILGRELYCSASIGITLFPEDGEDEETLVRHADIAMYEAKSAGGDGYHFFDKQMNERALERLELEYALRRALERRELSLRYQPQFELRSGRLVGYEALMRWRSREHGSVPPSRFIPIAEETGLILPMGEWALRTAALQINAWRKLGNRPVRIAVNLSARQFQHRDFESCVRDVLRSTGIDGRLLELELTESVVMTDPDLAEATLARLHRAGVQIAIDDFGTGYSSLAQLKRFPIGRLKIDRTFIDRIPRDPRDESITRAIIEMAHCLGMRTVAEGVEREEQLEFLKRAGCDEAQGYFFNRPLLPGPAGDLLRPDHSSVYFPM